MAYTIEKQGRSWAIMQGLRVVSLCVTLDQAKQRLQEVAEEKKKMDYTLIESNKMEDKEDYKLNSQSYLAGYHACEVAEKELRSRLEDEVKLLRDWRDTWLPERTLVHKENDELRKALSKIRAIIVKINLAQYQ